MCNRYISWLSSAHPQQRNLASNPGTCPDWELNLWPFGSQASTESTEPHQPGCNIHFFVVVSNWIYNMSRYVCKPLYQSVRAASSEWCGIWWDNWFMDISLLHFLKVKWLSWFNTIMQNRWLWSHSVTVWIVVIVEALWKGMGNPYAEYGFPEWRSYSIDTKSLPSPFWKIIKYN